MTQAATNKGLWPPIPQRGNRRRAGSVYYNQRVAPWVPGYEVWGAPYSSGAVLLRGTNPTPTTISVDADGTFIDEGGWQSATLDTIRSGGPSESNPYCGGLIEAARTNLLTDSQELHYDEDWDRSGANLTVTSNVSVVLAPDGTATAERLIVGAGNVHLYESMTLTDNLVYAFSVFAYAGSSALISLFIRDTSAPATRLHIDFSVTGGQGGVIAVSAETVGTGYVVDYGGGWYRLVGLVPVNTIVGANTHQMRIYPAGTVATNKASWFWGAQLEVGTFASTYIPTTAAAVARGADTLIYNSGVDFGTGAFSVYGLITPNWEGADEANDHYVFDTYSGGVGAYLSHLGAVKKLFAVASGGFSLISGVAVERHKQYAFGLAVNTNDAQFRVLDIDAGTIDNTADAAGTLPATHGSLYFGSDAGETKYWDGWIRDIVVYKARHTQANMDYMLDWLVRQASRSSWSP